MMVRLPPWRVLRAAPKKCLGGVEGNGVDAAGEGAAAGGKGEVVGAGEAGDAVQEDDDVALHFDEPLGAFEGKLGDAAVVFDGLVEGGAEDLPVDGLADVGDLLGAFAHEDDHEVDVRMVGGDAGGDVLEKEGLAGLGRGDDEAALPPADGGDDVDDAVGEVLGGGFELDAGVGIGWGEVFEVGAVLGGLGLEAVDGFDADEAVVAFALLGGADLADNVVAGAEVEAADLGLGDVDVALGGLAAGLAEEAVAVPGDAEGAHGQDAAALAGVGLEDEVLELVAAHLLDGAAVFEAHLPGEGQHFGLGLPVQCDDLLSKFHLAPPLG